MNGILKLILLSSVMKFSQQEGGMSFRVKPIFNRSVNIFAGREPLIYAFNVSALDLTIDLTQPIVNELCGEKQKSSELLNREFRDITTMRQIFDTEFIPEAVIFRKTFYSLHNLEADLIEFTNAVNKQKCEVFEKIALDYTTTYYNIDKLSYSDYMIMSQIINFHYLKSDVDKALEKFHPRNITTPIEFKYTYEGDFFSYVSLRMQFHGDTFFLIFNIPYYEKIDLYNMLNESDLITFNRSKALSINIGKLMDTCYTAKSEIFCGKPERDYLNFEEISEMENDCFNTTHLNDMWSDFTVLVFLFICIICMLLIRRFSISNDDEITSCSDVREVVLPISQNCEIPT